MSETIHDGAMAAIETTYAGCRFRSRLEARWAVFFDHAEIDWSYEPEGQVLADGTRYLPDFWLPRQRVWLEIKGPGGDMAKWRALHDAVNEPIGYLQMFPADGDQPERRSPGLPAGTPIPARTFLARDIPRPDVAPIERTTMWGPGSPHVGWAWGRCYRCGQLEIGHVAWPVMLGCGHDSTGPDGREQFDLNDRTVLAAYQRARSARFEHGESG